MHLAQPQCDFECIYVSWDQNEANFKQMAAMGPWWSIPFQDFNRRTQLGYALQVRVPLGWQCECSWAA